MMRLTTTFESAAEAAQELANLNQSPVGIWRHPESRWFGWHEDPEPDVLIDNGFEMWAVVDPDETTVAADDQRPCEW